MVNKTFLGNNPIITDNPRKHIHLVRIELEGYQPYEATFSRFLCGWIFENMIFEGVIGLAIDAINGGIYSLTPDQAQANLQANLVVHSKKSNDSFIAVVLQPDPSWKKVGNLYHTGS